MSNNTLSTLKFVQAERPAADRAVNPIEQRRINLIARIDEQIALATAQLEGKAPEFTRTIKNKETGQKETKAKKVKAWFWPQGSRFLLVIRYGTHTLQFAKGTNAIEAPSLKGVVTVLNTVKSAAQAGELDTAITAVSAKREKKNA